MSIALVVDDSATDLAIIASCLKAKGLTVLTARSGEEALVSVQETKPDIIVLDVVLPGSSGFEVCRELKSQGSTSKIPIIMCSTKGNEMDKFWGMKQGADAYIAKPVDQEEIIRTMQHLITV